MSGPTFGGGGFGSATFGLTPFYNTKTLIDAVLRATNHSNPENETQRRTLVLTFINNKYQKVCQTKPWDWMYQRADFLLKKPYSEGTISLVQGSEEVTGSLTQFSVNAIPYNVLVPGTRDEAYVIERITGNTALTLESQFAGEDLTDVSFEILKPSYELPQDIGEILSINVDGHAKITLIGPDEMQTRKGYSTSQTGVPMYATITNRREDGVRTLEVFPAPDDNYKCSIAYKVNICALTDAEDSIPLVPDRYRSILYYGALQEMLRFQTKLEESDKAGADFQMGLLAMMNDSQLTDSALRIQPRRNYWNRRGRFRTSMNRWDFSREE